MKCDQCVHQKDVESQHGEFVTCVHPKAEYPVHRHLLRYFRDTTLDAGTLIKDCKRFKKRPKRKKKNA